MKEHAERPSSLFRDAQERSEAKTFGPKVHSNPGNGLFVDVPAKKLRYLRENGLDLKKVNFYDAILQEKCSERFSADVELLNSIVRHKATPVAVDVSLELEPAAEISSAD